MNHKLGVHWIKTHGRPEDLDYIRRLQPPSVKLVAGDVPDPQWISDTYQAAPNALLVLRSHAMSEQKSDMAADPKFTGKRHAQEWNGHIEKLRNEAKRRGLPFPPLEQLVVLGINEPEVWSHLQQTVDYNVAFLDACQKMGLTAGALNLSVGWPANDGPDTPPNWAPYETVRSAIIRGRHYLFLHEYHDILGPAENAGWWCGRYEKCPWPDVRIIIGEYGIDRFVKDAGVDPNRRGWRGWINANEYTMYIRAYHEALLQDKRIHSVQIFSSDYSHPWDSFDLPEVYSHLLTYADEVRARGGVVVGPEPTAPHWYGYITAPAGLRLRTEPHTNANILTTIKHGEQVIVVGQDGGWLQATYDTLAGWLSAEWVSREPVNGNSTEYQRGSFEWAFAWVVGEEGIYSADRNDRGNWTSGIVGQGEFKGTKFGISAYSYPHLDIINLTLDEARLIYHKDYWLASKANTLPWRMALLQFDSAVQHHPVQALKFLAQAGENPLLYMGLRLAYYTDVASWPHHGKGWARRMARLMQELGQP